MIGFESMPPEPVHAVKLSCHPDTPTDAVHGIAARVRRMLEGKLAVTYVLEADLDRLRIPAPRAPRAANGLWRHTCCEIFIACKGLPAYREFNFSPSGEWATYAFDGYRVPSAGGLDVAAPVAQIAVRDAASRLELDAVIPVDCIPATQTRTTLSLALSAVVEERNGALSYWALRHSPGKPDFHHPEAFALELAASATPPARAGTPPQAGGER
jgi:hypothetical protein